MEAVVGRENMIAALKRVTGNKGKPGVDEMTVDELEPYLNDHWERIKAELIEDRYMPEPVRQAEMWNAGASHMNEAFKKSDFDKMGLVSLRDSIMAIRNKSRTVVYGTVRTVVERSEGSRPPPTR